MARKTPNITLFVILMFLMGCDGKSVEQNAENVGQKARLFWSAKASPMSTVHSSERLMTLHYPQTVDHFGDGPMSKFQFDQRVILDFSFTASGFQDRIHEGPILVYIGGRYNIGSWIEFVGVGPGIVTLAANHFEALIVYIEHRFYGTSVPYGSIDRAMGEDSVRNCLTTRQAIEDFASIISAVKQKFPSPDSPVIVMGESYGGFLAAQFRVTYPQLALGALSSSTAVTNALELPESDHYCTIVGKDFKETSETCFEYVSKSWVMIDQIAKEPQGLALLSKMFKTCRPLNSVTDLTRYLEQTFKFAVEYNGLFQGLKDMCNEIVRDGEKHILEGISRATFVVSGMEETCNNISRLSPIITMDSNTSKAWNWQACYEQLAITNCNNNHSMFSPRPFNLHSYVAACRNKYGANLLPIWNTTYQELKSALETNGSRIIFSNGLKDPWSGASILKDISSTIVAVTTNEGFHSLDMGPVQLDDPSWLINQRKKELDIMSKWIKKKRRYKMKAYDWTASKPLV